MQKLSVSDKQLLEIRAWYCGKKTAVGVVTLEPFASRELGGV